MNATLNSDTFLAERLAIHVTVATGSTDLRGSIDLTDMTGTARPDWDLSQYGATTLNPFASLNEDGASLSGGIQWFSGPIHEPEVHCDGGASEEEADSGTVSTTCTGTVYAGVGRPLCSSWILTRP